MTLSTQQIDQLYAFTRAHFVEYYDLQTELVDHLAHAIEAQWQQHPEKSFDQILNSEFKKFGIFGFSDIVEKRQMALSRKYHKIVLRHLRAFFAWPKIVVAVGVFGTFYFALKSITDQIEAFMIGFTLLTILLFFKIIKDSIKIRRRPKAEKRWLFEEIIRSYGNVSAFMIVPMQVIGHFLDVEAQLFRNPLALAAASLALTVYALFCYVIFKIIPSKADQYLRENYPEYGFETL